MLDVHAEGPTMLFAVFRSFVLAKLIAWAMRRMRSRQPGSGLSRPAR